MTSGSSRPYSPGCRCPHCPPVLRMWAVVVRIVSRVCRMCHGLCRAVLLCCCTACLSEGSRVRITTGSALYNQYTSCSKPLAANICPGSAGEVTWPVDGGSTEFFKYADLELCHGAPPAFPHVFLSSIRWLLLRASPPLPTNTLARTAVDMHIITRTSNHHRQGHSLRSWSPKPLHCRSFPCEVIPHGHACVCAAECVDTLAGAAAAFDGYFTSTDGSITEAATSEGSIVARDGLLCWTPQGQWLPGPDRTNAHA